MKSFFIVLLLTPIAHAGALKNWCASQLIAEDPYPFAEEPTDRLINYYESTRNQSVFKELDFRYASRLMTEVQAIRFNLVLARFAL